MFLLVLLNGLRLQRRQVVCGLGLWRLLVPMFGFVFTIDGLRHDISAVDHERLSRPTLAPVSPANTEWGDEDVR